MHRTSYVTGVHTLCTTIPPRASSPPHPPPLSSSSATTVHPLLDLPPLPHPNTSFIFVPDDPSLHSRLTNVFNSHTPTTIFQKEGKFSNLKRNIRESPHFWVDGLNHLSSKYALLFLCKSYQWNMLFAWHSRSQICLNRTNHSNEHCVKVSFIFRE